MASSQGRIIKIFGFTVGINNRYLLLMSLQNFQNKNKKKYNGNAICNKNAFQWDAYRPLVDRIPGGCPGGCLPKGASA